VLWEVIDPDPDPAIVPWIQLPTSIYFIVMAFIIPIVGGMICVILIPRIVLPLFLKTKGIIWGGFQNGYLETGEDGSNIRRWFSRSLLIALLVIGLIAAIISSIDPYWFITSTQYAEFQAEWGYPQFAPPITMSLAGFLSPIALGLWATAWFMEDAGLVHYKFPKDDETGFFEVEPVHVRFSSYVKGYAGVSSLIFIVTIFFLMINSWMNALFTLLMPFYAII
jgi:hypothetical protein